MAKRTFLQLCHTYNPKKHGIAGWFLSEKLDGIRAFWDGGISRGIPASKIAFANVEKDGRYKEAPIATGLWSRYGKVIHAPDWFVNNLPPILLDGELYCGRGNFQQLVSCVKKLHPIDEEWERVRYVVFDAPRGDEVFADGEVNNKKFEGIGLLARLLKNPMTLGFAGRLKWLETMKPSVYWRVHSQTQLAFNTTVAEGQAARTLDFIVDTGGEGIILKSPSSLWLPERSHSVLKYKAVQDAEGTVVGYNWGRQGKLLGLMGALILKQDNGKRLELSGFTEAEREMEFCSEAGSKIKDYGSEHPGEECADCVHNPKFPRGSRVTYRYRELTTDGVAKEARYYRNVDNNTV